MATERKPRSDLVRIASQRLAADVQEFISEIAFDFGAGNVAELGLTVADPTGRLDGSPLAALGTTVTMADDAAQSWQVGAIDAAYGAGIMWTYRCRSRLAKSLRQTFKLSAEVKVSPTEWVTRRVQAAGGVVVAQKSGKRVAIGQAGKSDRQSTLDVINTLAGELEWAWVEHSNTLFFGDPHWALEGGTGLPLWPVTWKTDPASDALALSVALSEDDTESHGTCDVSLPNAFGRRLRPWHRIELRNAGRYNGTWLVDSVSYSDDWFSAVDVSCTRPRKPAKKAGSTA